MSFTHVLTPRLQLDAVAPDDVEEHYALLSDARVWAHLPSGVHTARQQTTENLQRGEAEWERNGLGYWTARLRTDVAAGCVPVGLRPGTMVGTGGCTVRQGTDWWNLYYRLHVAGWGLGLAAELVTAALHAAHTVAPERPVIAYLLEHNERSRHRIERSGLSLVWRGPDAGNPDPDAVRLVYADRPVEDDVLARVIALP
jgi:RimJ/RimL family protein N-acetyltransferase